MLSLQKIYKKYIKGTAEKAVVTELTIHLCKLTNVVHTAGSFTTNNVYVTTKILKHLYDSKPAEEFDFVLQHLPKIVKYPDYILENKDGKRGTLCFLKEIDGITYFSSIELTEDIDPDGKTGMNYVVTAYRIRKEKYLKNYKYLWSWKGDIPSS